MFIDVSSCQIKKMFLHHLFESDCSYINTLWDFSVTFKPLLMCRLPSCPSCVLLKKPGCGFSVWCCLSVGPSCLRAHRVLWLGSWGVMRFTLIWGMAWHVIGWVWKARGQGPSSVPVAHGEVGLRSFHPHGLPQNQLKGYVSPPGGTVLSLLASLWLKEVPALWVTRHLTDLTMSPFGLA